MSDIDVHEIKLNLRYPNSRQEDITDAFMRGYQGAVKIGNDAVRRIKAEKAALERRIDELCAEVGRSQLNRDMWHDRAEDMRNRLSAAQAENAKLRELVDGLRYCANESHGRCAVRAIGSDLYASCCPLYDTSSGTDRCESLMRELEIKVDNGTE